MDKITATQFANKGSNLVSEWANTLEWFPLYVSIDV